MASLAAQYRRHREAFCLALELGCTPREAEAELRRREAQARDQSAQQKLISKMRAPIARQHDDHAETVQPWWMKD